MVDLEAGAHEYGVEQWDELCAGNLGEGDSDFDALQLGGGRWQEDGAGGGK